MWGDVVYKISFVSDLCVLEYVYHRVCDTRFNAGIQTAYKSKTQCHPPNVFLIPPIFFPIDLLGRGVFATKLIPKGSFVLEYRGELQHKIKEKKDETYVFEFRHQNTTYWYELIYVLFLCIFFLLL